MKNIFTKLLAIITLIVSAFSLVACGGVGKKPNLDLKEAAELLEERGYYVAYFDDEDDLDLGEVEYLEANKSDEDNEYQNITITVFKTTKLAKLYFEQIKMEYEEENQLAKFYMEMQELLLEEYEDHFDSDEIEKMKEDIDEMKKGLKESKKNKSFGRIGKIVWEGTPKAVEDTK